MVASEMKGVLGKILDTPQSKTLEAPTDSNPLCNQV